jgi:NADPH:quinone reductase-like Zn-dependent oxidoreductase
VGDRVLGNYFQGWLGGAPTRERLRTSLGGPLDGTLCELRVFPESGVVRIPDYLGDDEAATLPCAAVTAYNALSMLDRVGPEHTVLVQGTGGVSIFALQLAKLAGARVIVTSSSDDKLARARALGADATINYRDEPAWGERARVLTEDAGVDHIIEVGGAGTLEQSIRAVAIGGTISLIGGLAGNEQSLRLPLVFLRQVRLQGVVVGSRDATERLLKAMAQHSMKPVIDAKRFELAEIKDAYVYLTKGGHFGKVVVAIP